jgi:ribonuclease PH
MQVVLLQMDDTLHLDNFAELMAVASQGCQQIFATLQSEVKEYAVQLVEMRGSLI